LKPQIPWLRVFVEGVVIVGSILLAFGLQAWWEGRQENTEAVEMLLGLQADFDGHRSVFERSLGNYVGIQADLRILMDPVRAAELSVERLDSAFYRIITAPTLDLGSGTRDAVVMSGRLELIENEELRGRLAGWERFVDEVRDMQLMMRDYSWNHLAPFVASNGAPMGRAMATRTDWPVAHIGGEEARRGYDGVMRDSGFQSLLSMRYATSFWHVGAFEEADQEAEEILLLVAAELQLRR
jgi:hypothetical protein